MQHRGKDDDDSQIRFFGRAKSDDKDLPIDRYGNPIGQRQQGSPRDGGRSRSRHTTGRYHGGVGGERSQYDRSRNDGRADRHRDQQGERRYRTRRSQDASHRQGRQRTSNAPEQTSVLVKALVSYQFASRSTSVAAILAGRVTVNDQVVTKPNQVVYPMRDVLAVDGQVLLRKSVKPITIVFHKPKGLPSSREDGVETLYSFIANKRAWFFPKGGLPASASGIVLISNDKRHRVTSESTLAKLTHDLWIKVPGTVSDQVVATLPCSGRIGQQNVRTTWLVFERTSCSLRQLSVMLKALGLEVLAWERRRIGPFATDQLQPGAWYQLDDQQVVAIDELVESGIADDTPLEQVWESIAQRLRSNQDSH
ncbi:MAG: hypothetical protein J5I53_10145 [Bradyrhizobiaceae bacterium]|nr:hypothetical protein [Bradyrhizobiaceae bacterium]